MTSLVSGSDQGTRVGSRIAITEVEIEGVLTGGQTGTVADDASNVIRFVVGFWDGYNNITPLATTGVNINSALDDTTCRSLVSKYLDTYVILESANALTAGFSTAVKTFTWRRRFSKPLIVTYTGTAAASGNEALVFSAISDSSAIPNPGFTQGRIKMSYIDA